MDLPWGIVNPLVAAAISAVVTWLVGEWQAARAAAQWTLERVTGGEWTLRRDSLRTAFDLRVYEEGNGERAGRVVVVDAYIRRDIDSGVEVRVKGIAADTEVRLDWVERDKRLASKALIRDGMSRVVLTRRDAHPFTR